MFGVGSVAQFVLGKSKFGGFISVNFGWALGVTFGIHWSLGVSGIYTTLKIKQKIKIKKIIAHYNNYKQS